MNIKRAREISASPIMTKVSYNGTPIYIENVDDNNTATVHPLDNPGRRQKVSLSALTEQ